MQVVDLFSGIGGFSLSASWVGWETVQFVEIDNYCQRILNKHWPNVPIHSDIKTFGIETLSKSNWNSSAETIITGGFPCQPFSVAGKQKGQSDNRHLWPEMLRVIREIRPAWIVGENVPGIIRMELENICLALEGEGYEVQPFIIPSASVGAWDKRERVWIIAYNNKIRRCNEQKENGQSLSDQIRDIKVKKQVGRKQQCGTCEPNIITTNTSDAGIKEVRPERQNPNILNSDPDKFNSDNAGYGLHGRKQKRETRECGHYFKECDWWQRNWIEVASELCGSNARVPHRLDRIKGLGNSVNPYVPYQIFKAIQQYEDNLKVEPKNE